MPTTRCLLNPLAITLAELLFTGQLKRSTEFNGNWAAKQGFVNRLHRLAGFWSSAWVSRLPWL